jgi:hypothetical protein
MATISSGEVTSTISPKYIEAGAFSMFASYTYTASSGDVVQMVKVHPNFRVRNVLFAHAVSPASAGDTVTLNMTVGDGNDTDRYITTFSASAGVVRTLNNTAGMGYLYSAVDTVDVVIASITGSGSANSVVTLNVYVTGDGDEVAN